MTFDELGLIEPLARAVRDEGYVTPTPIQLQAIPPILEGRDVLGLAQTGTGKTAAFALPILQRLSKSGRKPVGDRPIAVLILTPTRELAAQIGDSFATYGKHLPFKHTVIFGGVGQAAQERALRSGVDVLVATPGRLLDLHSQRVIHINRIDTFVLDEADRMLDMGFIHDVKRVIALIPPKRQTLFFSATMPPEAQKLADVLLKDPVTVAVTPISSTVDTVTQKVFYVEKNDKRHLLIKLFEDPTITRALVFSRTKHGANRISEYLERANIEADAIHGNKSQNARERALARFKKAESRALVATDIAARGIDIDELSHVINFDLPNVPETYVHRIGRTGRAGQVGTAYSFVDGEERAYLRDIERLIRRRIDVVDDHPYKSGGNNRPLPPPSDEPGPRSVNRGSHAHEQPRPQAPGGRGDGGRSRRGGGGGGHRGGGGSGGGGGRGGSGGGRGGGGGGGGRPSGGGGGGQRSGSGGASGGGGRPSGLGGGGRPSGGPRPGGGGGNTGNGRPL